MQTLNIFSWLIHRVHFKMHRVLLSYVSYIESHRHTYPTHSISASPCKGTLESWLAFIKLGDQKCCWPHCLICVFWVVEIGFLSPCQPDGLWTLVLTGHQCCLSLTLSPRPLHTHTQPFLKCYLFFFISEAAMTDLSFPSRLEIFLSVVSQPTSVMEFRWLWLMAKRNWETRKGRWTWCLK